MTGAVDRGGVDPVDAQFERATDRGDGIRIVLRTPGKFPARAANSPSAKANRSYLQIGVPKFSCFHRKPRTETRMGPSHAADFISLSLQRWMSKGEEKLVLARRKTCS